MPDRSKFNPEYRPVSYWDADGILKGLIANIKGTERKAYVQAMLASGKLYALFEEVLEESLDDEHRQAAGAVHPMFMSGEYLPSYLPGEVEIARVTMRSTTGDVIAVRARPLPNGKIGYRVTDEYWDSGDSHFVVTPTETDEPLSQSELIDLIDSVDEPGQYPEPASTWPGRKAFGLTDKIRDYNFEWYADPEATANFLTVHSDFYPDLHAYYEEEAKEWYTRVTRYYSDEDEEEDE